MTIHTVAVIHTPDMERILSLLRILITKRVEIIDLKFDQTGSVVTKRREDLRILYLVNSILDVALSVAASVIASLLLLSGDIEQNPGPGKEGCCVHIYSFKDGINVPLFFKFTGVGSMGAPGAGAPMKFSEQDTDIIHIVYFL